MYRMLLFMTLPLYAMNAPESPKKSSPKELAVILSVKMFDRQDDEVIAAFSQILTRDRKGNLALLELRYRAVQLLEQEKIVCGTLRDGEKH